MMLRISDYILVFSSPPPPGEIIIQAIQGPRGYAPNLNYLVVI